MRKVALLNCRRKIRSTLHHQRDQASNKFLEENTTKNDTTNITNILLNTTHPKKSYPIMCHTLLLILQLRICLLPDPMPLGTLVILKNDEDVKEQKPKPKRKIPRVMSL